LELHFSLLSFLNSLTRYWWTWDLPIIRGGRTLGRDPWWSHFHRSWLDVLKRIIRKPPLPEQIAWSFRLRIKAFMQN